MAILHTPKKYGYHDSPTLYRANIHGKLEYMARLVGQRYWWGSHLSQNGKLDEWIIIREWKQGVQIVADTPDNMVIALLNIACLPEAAISALFFQNWVTRE